MKSQTYKFPKYYTCRNKNLHDVWYTL